MNRIFYKKGALDPPSRGGILHTLGHDGLFLLYKFF